jgi:SAM-dependent methyltransferase
MPYQPSPFRGGLADCTSQQAASIRRGTPYHALEIGGQTIPGLIPADALRRRLHLLGLPEDLSGRTLLDVGAASGWNSFEAERRGAEVTALDYVPYEELLLARRLSNSSIRYLIADFDQVTAAQLGTFDTVLFLGVLYHLRHPLRGLETVCALCRGDAYIESFISDSHHDSGERDGGPVFCEFYETDQLDNWWGPTRRALVALCRAAGFTTIEFRYVDDRRAGLVCSRRPHQPAPDAAPAPFLSGVAGNRSGCPRVTEGNDEYLSIHFDAAEPALDPADVHVRLGDFGVPVLAVHSSGGQAYQATARLPLWAAAGRYDLSVCTAASAWSNRVPLEVQAYAGPSTAPADPFTPQLPAPDCAVWAPELRIHQAVVRARPTAFPGLRVLDLKVYLASGIDTDPDEPILLSVDGRWYPAFRVTLTPAGFLQLQALRILDHGEAPAVLVSAALPDRRACTPALAVTLGNPE